MKNVACLIFISCLSMTDLSAQNLVPNSDFEIRDADFCGISSSSDLGASLADWYSPSNGSPDVFFTDIAPSCWNYQPISTYPGPIGVKGEQLPRSGNSMIGLGVYTIATMNQREYVQVELTSPLVVTGKYLVECYVSLADFTEMASNNLGFYLSEIPYTNGGNGVLNVSPQYQATNVIGETQNWVRISDTITATDSFKFLTIGNFSDDASTTVVGNPTASSEPGMYGAYYFIDDVRVERVFTDVTTSLIQLETIDVRIFPNPTTDEIHIELAEQEVDVEINLMDVNGKIVLSITESFKERRIDMREFDDGVYFIRIETKSGAFSERIVKK